MGPMMDGRGWGRPRVHGGCLRVFTCECARSLLFLPPSVRVPCIFITMSQLSQMSLFCMYTSKKLRLS